MKKKYHLSLAQGVSRQLFSEETLLFCAIAIKPRKKGLFVDCCISFRLLNKISKKAMQIVSDVYILEFSGHPDAVFFGISTR